VQDDIDVAPGRRLVQIKPADANGDQRILDRNAPFFGSGLDATLERGIVP